MAQLRSWLPGPIGGILWFGVDDASFSVHAPFHGPLVAFVICFLGGTDKIEMDGCRLITWLFLGP